MKCYLDNSEWNALGFWSSLSFFLCALWALHSRVQLQSRRRVQEGSQEATTSGTAQGHWPCTCHSWDFFPTRSAVSWDEDCANSPDNLLQCFTTLTVVKLFLLCNLDLTCRSLNTSLCLLPLGEVKNSFFLSPYGSLCFVWGFLRHVLSSCLPLSQLINYSSFEKLFNLFKST